MKTSKVFNLRVNLLQWLVNHTASIYLKIFKSHKSEWRYSKSDLRSFPTGSLGKELANFLDDNKIDLIPKAENHDVFHMVTGYKTTAEQEIAMQYWLVGNGKLTPYTIGTCIIGIVIIPEYFKSYKNALKKGIKSPTIFDWKFEELLYSNASQIRSYIHQEQPVLIQQFF